jgi:Rrf2 family protein
MRLTRAAEYAVRCVLYMAGQPNLPVISKKEISRNMEIPEQFLGKIAQQLSRAGIVEILQGARGGLRLLRAPVDISLLEVIEAVMGEIFLNDCIMSPQSCKRVPGCAVHEVWENAREGLRRTLGDADFEQLSRSTCNQ